MPMKGRVLSTLLFSLCVVLVASLVVSAKLPTSYTHTRGLYIFWDEPDLNMNPPQYPAVGGFWRYNWSEQEPTNGTYDWSAVDTWILRELQRGKLAAVGFSVFNEYRGQGSDRGIQVPGWVRTVDSNSFWLNTRRSPEVWYLPNYWNSAFRTYYQRYINAFAQHLADNPTLRDRVAWISMGVGLSGETQPSSRWVEAEAPDWYFYNENKGITQAQWVEYVNWCSLMYKQAFSSRGMGSLPIFLDIGPTYSGIATEREQFSSYAKSIGVGIRSNTLKMDREGSIYEQMRNPDYYNTVPTSWETYQGFLPSRADVFWGLLCGLSKHPDSMTFDKLLWQTEEYWPLFTFARSYCAVTAADTPGAWVGLRQTEQHNGEQGNYSLYLTQKDTTPDAITTPAWNIGQDRGYKFDVPNGTYQVDLHFAEVYYNAAGARVFDIVIEGVVVQSSFDIWAAAGGKNKPVVRTYTVSVSDGRLDIDFVQKTANEATAHAIRVSGPGYLQRINCGGTRYTDGASNVWAADQEYEAGAYGYVGGSKYASTGDIVGTTDDPLYQTMRIITTGSPAVGRFCRRTDQASGNNRMRFDIDNNYMYYGNFTSATITVTYFDTGFDKWELRYDAIGSVDKAATPVGSANAWVQKYNSGTWKTAVFYLTDARFANGQTGSTDFSIYSSGDGNEWISFVQVTKGGSPPAVTPTPTPTLTPTPIASTLQGYVTLQGRPSPPDNSYICSLTVTVGDTNHDVTTDTSGYFTLADLTPGTYDICVKGSHTLSTRTTGVTLVAGMNEEVGLGELREGDADTGSFSYDIVNIRDFGVLANAFPPYPYNAQADFNQDTYITILDFGLMRANFGAMGDCIPSASPPESTAPTSASAQGAPVDGYSVSPTGDKSLASITGDRIATGEGRARVGTPYPLLREGAETTSNGQTVLVRLGQPPALVRAGETFVLTVELATGGQPVDGAEVHLDFDPSYLQVVDGNGEPTDRIESTGVLDLLLMNQVRTSGTLGQIDFAAGTLSGDNGGQTAPQTIALATVRFKALMSSSGQGGSPLTFVSELPRRTEVIYGGASVLGGVVDAFVAVRAPYVTCLPFVQTK